MEKALVGREAKTSTYVLQFFWNLVDLEFWDENLLFSHNLIGGELQTQAERQKI